MARQLKINRRTLLIGTAAAAMGGALSSCRPSAPDALRISLLTDAIPAEVLKKFRQQTNAPVKFQTLNQLSGLFQQLQRWQLPDKSKSFSLKELLPWVEDPKQIQPDNLVSLDDYWLAGAIAQDLIEPLQLKPGALEKLPADWLQNWQQFINQGVPDRGGKNLASQNQDAAPNLTGDAANTIWAAPYRVQSLVVVYREGKVLATSGAEPFSSWRDLLDPTLQNRIAMPDHPRIVLGLLQKIRSGSFNPSIESSAQTPPTASDIERQLAEQLGEPLAQLNRQVRTYDGENSLKALINGDVDVAVSWSADIVAAQRRYQDLKMTIPTEGSLLSADVWVRPKGAPVNEAAKDWIEYCWEMGPATQISRSGEGLSPVFLGKESRLPPVLASGPLSLEAIQNSEPILPLSAAVQTAYFNFWQQERGRYRRGG